MKVWIVGAQGTHKDQIALMLTGDGLKFGRLFSNITTDDSFYHRNIYKFYESDDIKSIFENNAYLFMNNMFDQDATIFEGLDMNTWDLNDVFVLNIDQFNIMNINYIGKDDLIVWVDGTKSWRINNLSNSYMDYDSSVREAYEKSHYEDFWKIINTLKTTHKNVIYFHNEDPERVKTIIKTIYNYPKLKGEFVKNFGI